MPSIRACRACSSPLLARNRRESISAWDKTFSRAVFTPQISTLPCMVPPEKYSKLSTVSPGFGKSYRQKLCGISTKIFCAAVKSNRQKSARKEKKRTFCAKKFLPIYMKSGDITRIMKARNDPYTKLYACCFCRGIMPPLPGIAVENREFSTFSTGFSTTLGGRKKQKGICILVNIKLLRSLLPFPNFLPILHIADGEKRG